MEMMPDPVAGHDAPGSKEDRLARKRKRQKEYRERYPDRVAASHAKYDATHREAVNATKTAWKRANAEKHRASSRATHLKANYGLTVDEYNAMVISQCGRCAICGQEPRVGKRLAVDHCHDTGRVRGLLCVPCNAALGVLEGRLHEVQRYLDVAI